MPESQSQKRIARMLQVSFTTTLTQPNLLAFFPRNIPLSLLDLTTPDNVSLASPLLELRRLSSLASKGQYAYGCNFSPFLRTSPPPLALYRSPVCVADVLAVLFVLVDLLVPVVFGFAVGVQSRRVAPSSSSSLSSSSRARLRSFSSTILSFRWIYRFGTSCRRRRNRQTRYVYIEQFYCASKCLRIFESSSKSNSAPTGSRAPALALEACASRALRKAPSEPPLLPR